MLPLTAGFLIGGPSAGFLSDRLGARGFATAGMLCSAIGFGLLLFLPANFSYLPFALLLLLVGVSMGMFVAPNTAGVMNSVPADRRGVASGMLATFQNSGMTLSIGIFFSLMIAGLSSTLPSTMFAGLTAHGVSATVAHHVANLPPVGSLFAAFLGYNPITTLLGPSLHTLSASQAAYLSGQAFFPNLISNPFIAGMHITFAFSVVMMLVGATASWLRGASPARPAAAPRVAARTEALSPPVG
jgi:MFS family permease